MKYSLILKGVLIIITYMELLISKKDDIFKIKENIKTDMYYNHSIINDKECTENTITIVMATSNRSQQTYYTLNTFLRNVHKDIQVIIIDDSTHDKIDINRLKEYPFMIDFIEIKRINKNWVNPCVNYNIGFQFIKGGKVIIQNAEVCHVGYVIDYVHNNINNDKEFVPFDVASVRGLNNNNNIYSHGTENIDVYNLTGIWGDWYQHTEFRDRGFHFLMAMTRNVFDMTGGFSYDHTFGACYDDEDFIFKLIWNNIKKASISYKKSLCGGIHLSHSSTTPSNYVLNESISVKKQEYYNKTGKYIDITDSPNNFYRNIELLK